MPSTREIVPTGMISCTKLTCTFPAYAKESCQRAHCSRHLFTATKSFDDAFLQKEIAGKGTCGNHRRLNILSAQLHGQIVRKGPTFDESADLILLVSIYKQSEGDADRSPPAALSSRTQDFNERGVHAQCSCNGPDDAI